MEAGLGCGDGVAPVPGEDGGPEGAVFSAGASHKSPEMAARPRGGTLCGGEAQCLCLWRQDYERSYESLGLLRRMFSWTPILALTDVSDNLTQNYRSTCLFEMRRVLKALWQFCSYVFIPQRGNRKA